MSNILLVTAAAAGLAVSAGAAPLEIDYPHSKIEVAVSATVDSFTGRLEKYQATVDAEPAAALPAQAGVTFDFSDLKTGNASRDAAMLAWLQYASNSTAVFQLKSWRQSGATNLALGELTFHGVRHALEMPVTVTHQGDVWDITGGADVDYLDFNLPKIRKALFLTVDPLLKVNFHLVGKLPPAK